jgi:hypothetical protein
LLISTFRTVALHPSFALGPALLRLLHALTGHSTVAFLLSAFTQLGFALVGLPIALLRGVFLGCGTLLSLDAFLSLLFTTVLNIALLFLVLLPALLTTVRGIVLPSLALLVLLILLALQIVEQFGELIDVVTHFSSFLKLRCYLGNQDCPHI